MPAKKSKRSKQPKATREEADAAAIECVQIAEQVGHAASQLIQVMAPDAGIVPALHVDVGGRLLISGVLNEDPEERCALLDHAMESIVKYAAKGGIQLNYQIVTRSK